MGSAIHSQTDERPCWPPPYTGYVDPRTDRSASFPSSPAPAADERSGRRRWPVGLPARHHGPDNAGHLVGQSHGRQLARLVAEQVEQPLGGGRPPWLGVLDNGGRAPPPQTPPPVVPPPPGGPPPRPPPRGASPAPHPRPGPR